MKLLIKNEIIKLNPKWCHKRKATIPEELLLAEEYLNRAKHSWCVVYGDKNAGLNEMRSVVAILIRCFENHGVSNRNN